MKTKNVTIAVSGAVCGLVLAEYGAHAQSLFVASYGSESIVEVSGGTQSTFATGMDYPTGLAFDSSGDLFVSDQFSGHIYEWVGAGSTRTTFASGLNQPGPLAFNSAGDLYALIDGEVDEFNTSGAVINTITGFTVAEGLAFDRAGDLFVSDSSKGTVTEITSGGVRSTFASGLSYPTGMAFNAAGDLFVADGNGANTVTEITPSGSESLFASNLNYCSAIAFDPAGDMFVADAGQSAENGDITEFAANGTRSVFSTTISKPTTLAFQGAALPVPEPSAYVLVGLGFAAMLGGSRKRQKLA